MQRLLIPLLQRLGFSIVFNYHGMREFGKDLIFGEIDRFGHVCYYGLQAKHIPSVSLSASQEIIIDCNQAFANPFRHPQTGAEEFISVFYAVNAGEISEPASTNIFRSLRPRYGNNVRLLDGKAILALDRYAAISRLESVREKLEGLRVEIKYNHHVIPIIRPFLVNFTPGMINLLPTSRLCLEASATYITGPTVPDERFTDNVTNCWHYAREINYLLDVMALDIHEINMVPLITRVLEMAAILEVIEAKVQEESERILRTLGPLVGV